MYILDEPEAALSPQRQLALLLRVHELVQSGSQFVISTHSPILKAFLQDPAGRMRQLFREHASRSEEDDEEP